MKTRQPDNEDSSLGANTLKFVGYGYHKKNEFLEKALSSASTKSYPSLSIRAMPHLFNFASNLLEDKSRSLGGATVSTLFDAGSDKVLGAGPMLAIEAVGQAADIACARLEPKIKQIAMQPGWHPELEVLQEGQVILEALRLPKKVLGHVKGVAKALAFDLYDFLKQPKALESVQETHHLLDKIAPHATRSLGQYSDYLLTHLAQSKKDINALQDVLQTPAFRDVLQKLQLSQQLTRNQTGLLTLYAAGQNTPKAFAALPDTQSLQKDLLSLESALRMDLSQKSPSDSFIFSEIHSLTASHLKLLAPESAAKSLSALIPKEKLAFATRLQDACYKVDACSNLLGQVASLSGNHKIAGKIVAIGSGTSRLLSGTAMLATGNIFGGIMGIGQGICSFFGGLFGDDDDDGDDSLSIVSQQIHNVHEDMIEGFNQVLLQQTALARGLSSQLLSLGQATMLRFDHVDEQLQRIDAHLLEAYKQLMTQQQYLGQQIHHLSQQLTQTERNIFNGLQQVHSNLVQSIHKMGAHLSKGLIALSDQLDNRFRILDQNLHKTAQELSLRMVQNRLNQAHFFHQIQGDLASLRALLLTQNQQSHAIQQDHFIQQATQYRERQNTLQEQYTAYAKRFLQSEGITKFRRDKLYLYLDTQINNLLTGANIELSPEAICKTLGKPAQWRERDPFDYINLLRRHVISLDPETASAPVLQKDLVHFPVWYKNCEAWIQGELAQENRDPQFWFNLGVQSNKAREIIMFSDYCAQPKVLTALFTQCAKNTEKLSQWLLQKQEQHQQRLHLSLQANLVARLQQSRLECESLKISNSMPEQSAVLNLFETRMKEIEALTLDFSADNPGTLRKPAQYFIPFTRDQKTFILPWQDKQLPPIPQYCLTLEQCDLGQVHAYGHYEANDQQLYLTVEFKAKGQKSAFLLAKQALSVDPHLHPLLEDCIRDAWQNFTWSDSQPQEESEALRRIYEAACVQFRLTLNNKTQHDFLDPVAQHLAKALDASSGMMHLYLKLLFESFYQAGQAILPDILSACINSEQLQHWFENYQGEHPHFLTAFSQLESGHAFLLKQLLDLLARKQIYVENLRLNNALLFLDNLTLNHLNTKEKTNWLEKAVTTFPESAIMHLLYGVLLAETNAVEKALKHLEKAVHLKPDDNQIRLCYAACLQQTGKHPKAIQEFGSIIQQLHQALDQGPDDAIAKALALSLITAFMQRGNAFFKGGYFAAALADYEKAILLQADNPDFLYKQAYTLECLGYGEKARTIYQGLLKLNPQHSLGMEGLARCLEESDPHQALACYQTLLNRFPLTGLKMQCALLSLKINPAAKPGKDWLLEVAQDPQATREDLLLCCELSFPLDCINTTRLAFSLVKDKLHSREDFQRAAVIAKNLNNSALWANFTRKYKLAPPEIKALPRERLKECTFKSGTGIKYNPDTSFFNPKRAAVSSTGAYALENKL